MNSSVTSSSVLAASGIDVLVPFHHVGSHSPSPLISSSPSSMPTTNVKQRSMSLPSPPGMSGLLSSRSLVQATEDEKLVVATLATLDSGSASTLIKQDLKLIIQSRRKAEGKEEIKVEFKKPIKDELTSEEVVKRMRRRELNRLAARRSREKGQKRKEKLVEEIKLLQSQNSKLSNDLTFLTDERDNIVNKLRHHMKECSDYAATRTAAAGLPRRVLDMLGFLDPQPSTSSSSLGSEDRTPSSLAISNLHIDISPANSSSVILIPQSPHSLHQSSIITTTASVITDTSVLNPASNVSQKLTYSSCPPSPVVIGLSGTHVLVGQGPPSPSNPSSPFHFTPPSSSPSSSQTTAAMEEDEISRLSQDSSSAAPFSPPLNSPRKSYSHSHFHPHHQYPHHSPRHESTPLSLNMHHSIHLEIKDEDSEFARPSSSISADRSRFLLERSFSCPSSSNHREYSHHRETSSSSSRSSSPQTVLLSKSDEASISSVRDDSFSSSYSSMSGSSNNDRQYSSVNEQEAPLDLVVRSDSNREIDNDDSFPSLYSVETWPRRSAGRLPMIRGSGRRWSVDDQHSAHLREPLNLSTRTKK